MDKRRFLGKSALIAACLALMILSVWEACIRLDAMYAPLKMFFSMASGEGISFATAMSYFDFSIFEAPVWLAGCVLVSLLSLALSSRPKGSAVILLLSVVMALYGLTRSGTFLTGFWRLIQPALLMIIAVLSAVNLLSLPVRRKRGKTHEDSFPDAPRMTDAPRLRGVSSAAARKKRAG